MKQKNRFLSIFFFLLTTLSSIAQGYRNAPINKVWDAKLGFKCLLFGGLIWGIGMLLILVLKKNEKGTVENDQFFAPVAGFLCVVGGLTAMLGLILLGF